jgi:hypothetical protein
VQYHSNLPAEIVWIHASLPAVLWGLLVWSWLEAGRPAVVAAPEEPAPRAGAIAA